MRFILAAVLAIGLSTAAAAQPAPAPGSPDAQRAYARALQVQASDPAESARQMQRAAELGHGRAAWELGMRYIEGDGAPADQAQALAWFRRSAEAGDVLGQHAMGVMNANALGGLVRNQAEARRWYELAAAQGYAGSLAALGGMMHMGQGGPADPARARAFVELAAEAGDETGAEILAQLPRDLDPAARLEVDRIKAQWVSAHGKPRARSSD